jgi:hypothetical protein
MDSPALSAKCRTGLSSERRAGFTAKPENTWADFAVFLIAEKAADGWDLSASAIRQTYAST